MRLVLLGVIDYPRSQKGPLSIGGARTTWRVVDDPKEAEKRSDNEEESEAVLEPLEGVSIDDPVRIYLKEIRKSHSLDAMFFRGDPVCWKYLLPEMGSASLLAAD